MTSFKEAFDAMRQRETFAIANQRASLQTMALALAVLSLDRPGWTLMLRGLAAELDVGDLFDSFRALNADRFEATTFDHRSLVDNYKPGATS